MVATTVTQKYVSDKGLFRLVQNKSRSLKYPNEVDGFSYIVKLTSETIATTSIDEAADTVEFFTFPEGAKLEALLVDFGDLDSGAGLVVDIQADSTVLINNSTAGQTGAVDELDAGLQFTDVGGMTLKMVVDTQASTAVAGTVVIYAKFYMGSFLTL